MKLSTTSIENWTNVKRIRLKTDDEKTMLKKVIWKALESLHRKSMKNVHNLTSFPSFSLQPVYLLPMFACPFLHQAPGLHKKLQKWENVVALAIYHYPTNTKTRSRLREMNRLKSRRTYWKNNEITEKAQNNEIFSWHSTMEENAYQWKTREKPGEKWKMSQTFSFFLSRSPLPPLSLYEKKTFQFSRDIYFILAADRKVFLSCKGR